MRKGPGVKECMWSFEAESGKGTDYPKERRTRRNTALPNFDFILLTSRIVRA